MKSAIVKLAIIASVLIVFYFVSCNKKTAENGENIIQGESSKPKVHNPDKNIFPELRQAAFLATPEKLGLNIVDDTTTVYGVVMDWEMQGAVATTISYMTGDASLYLSSGSAVIGGGQHQTVNVAAKQFVAVAQKYLRKTKKTDTNRLPDKNEINFYLLTNKGVYLGVEKFENVQNNSSEWIELFESGNTVLSEIRFVSDASK